MKASPHPNYRESDVPFVRELPTTWDEKPLKAVAELLLSNIDKHRVEGQPSVRLCNYTDVYYNERITGELEFMQATASPAQISRLTLADGDVILTKDSEDPTDIGVPTVVVGDIPRLVCGYHLAVAKPRSIHGPFLRYFLASLPARAHFYTKARGLTRYGLGKDDLSNIDLPIPEQNEQRTIAAFLDHETARIDRLIEKQQRLIELLKEKRQAVISHAVTKGLDPKAPMKDSGVEWLGEVPAHWMVGPFKFIVSAPVTDGPHETPDFLDEGVVFISAEAIKNGKIDFSRKRGFISKTDNLRYSRKYKPQKNDIYMVKSGATTGQVAMVGRETDFNIWSPLAAIRCDPRKAFAKFVFVVMQSAPFRTSVELGWSFGTQQNIGMGVIENLPIPLPPLTEQRKIVQFLSPVNESIEKLIKKANLAIILAEERRSALISAAVTGKIDVRNWKPADAVTEETATA